MNKNEFIESVKELGIYITEEQMNLLDKYYKLLVDWNEKINLTAITEEKDVYLKHFYDSITLIKAVDLNSNLNLCDVGSGAGFPGLVLKIIFPNLKIVLVDSLNKRVNFLNEVIKELNLKDIIAIHSRIEDYAKKNREVFDIVTCRAVSKLNIISELCIPLVKVGGYFIPMKGNIEEEIKDTSYLNKLNSSIKNIISFKLPIENSIRNLIIIEKNKITNIIYPRSFNLIKSKPL